PQPQPQRDRETAQVAALSCRDTTQLRQARLQLVRRELERLPAIAEPHGAADRGAAHAADDDRDAAGLYRLRHHAGRVQREKAPREAGRLVAPQAAKQPDDLVGDRATLRERRRPYRRELL